LACRRRSFESSITDRARGIDRQGDQSGTRQLADPHDDVDPLLDEIHIAVEQQQDCSPDQAKGFSGPECRFRFPDEHGSPDGVVYHAEVRPQVFDTQRRRVVAPRTMNIAERLEIVFGDCNAGIVSSF
jgi:hypothetical protein